MFKIQREHFESIDSTNTWALGNADGLEQGVLMLTTANIQTASRGRFNKRWLNFKTESVNATYSFLIDPQRKDLGNIPQVASLSVAKTLRQLTLLPQLKWPNDVLVNQRKIAGILGETTFLNRNRELLCLVVGIGINVNVSSEDLAQFDLPGTSLYAETGIKREIEEIINLLTYHFHNDLSHFIHHGFEPFLNSYRQQLFIQQGDLISFHSNGEKLSGNFNGISNTGSLMLKKSDGTISEFVSGEILFQRNQK